ncbi:hypothetical protein AB1H94_17680 [Pseudomonas fulva]|uniref:hypothetical protein n=1 Tax=Pseudomonas fulva TaxID=47880 RepID=UPI00345D0625
MIIDGVLVGLGAFGAAAFSFACGFVVGGSRSPSSVVFPAMHVSFDPDSSDEDRLKFLDAARDAIRLGQLRKANQLGDDPTSDKGQ